MKKLFIFLSFFAGVSLFANNSVNNEANNSQCAATDTIKKSPSFVGGEPAMYQWLCKNIQYPNDAAAKGIAGRVLVDFVVEEDGSITDVNVLKAVYPVLDIEAVRLVYSMPKWLPGMINDVPVKVNYQLPITFNLSNAPKKVDINTLPAVNKLVEALTYQIKKKFMGNLHVVEGKVDKKDNTVNLELKLEDMSNVWNKDSMDNFNSNLLLKEIFMPYSSEFRKQCEQEGIILKCSIIPGKKEKPFKFEVTGNDWQL